MLLRLALGEKGNRSWISNLSTLCVFLHWWIHFPHSASWCRGLLLLTFFSGEEYKFSNTGGKNIKERPQRQQCWHQQSNDSLEPAPKASWIPKWNFWTNLHHNMHTHTQDKLCWCWNIQEVVKLKLKNGNHLWGTDCAIFWSIPSLIEKEFSEKDISRCSVQKCSKLEDILICSLQILKMDVSLKYLSEKHAKDAHFKLFLQAQVRFFKKCCGSTHVWRMSLKA